MSRPLRALVAPTLALTLTAALAAGCSSEDPEADREAFAAQTAEQIAEAARNAMSDLDSMRLVGTLDSDGTPFDVDLAIGRDGDCSGSIGLEDGTAELLGVGGRVWFRPDREFWLITAGTEDLADQLLAVADGRWVKLPPGNESYTALCDLDTFLGQVLEQDGAAYTKGEVDEVDGDPAIGIVSQGEDRPESTGFVALDSPHRLLRIAREAGAVTFAEFDVEIEVEEPAADEQVGLEEIQRSVI